MDKPNNYHTRIKLCMEKHIKGKISQYPISLYRIHYIYVLVKSERWSKLRAILTFDQIILVKSEYCSQF